MLDRFRALLGEDKVPSGLGLVFLLSMIHELARADDGELRAQQLVEFAAHSEDHQQELLAMVDMIRGSYPEIADQLFGDQATEATGGRGGEIDLAALAGEIVVLEQAGYLDAEDAQRLNEALRVLHEADEGGRDGEDAIIAQVDSTATAEDVAGTGPNATGSGATGAEAQAVDIEALPAPGAGPLVALGPVLGGGAAVATVDIIGSGKIGAGPPDTTAPSYVSTSTSIANQKITLTYSEALSSTAPPLAGSFQVQTRATANDPWTSANITQVEVSGSTVILSLQGTPLAAGRLLQITYTDPTTGNDANAIQDLAGNDAASVVISTGIVADGYVRGAQIYIDTNGDGIAQASERLEGVITDANGNFFLPSSANGPILAVGGVNIDTGVPNTIVMKAPSGSTMISPLTTLVQTYIEQNGGTVASANTAVVSALGLTLPAGQTLATYDPLAALSSNGSDATALAVQKAAAQVATVVQAAAASPAAGSSATTVAKNVIANLVNQVETANAGSTHVDLTSTSTLNAVLLSSGTSVSTASVHTATDAIAAASNLNTVVQAQAALLDTITPVAPTSVALAPASDSGATGDGLTNTATPSVRVTLNVTATDGTAAVAGNTVDIYVGASATAAAHTTLSATDIANGYVDIAVSGLPANATSNLTARISDAASHTSVASTAFALTIDTNAPTAPGFALAADTGVSSSDGITNNAAVHVTGLEAGTTWQYSTDGGSHWTAGTGSDFMLPGSALYLAGAVQVRQVDAAGNVSTAAVSSGNITVGLGTPLTIPTGAAETTTIQTLIAQGNADHYVTVLDLADNATTLNSTEAAALVQAGLEFAASDIVTVQQATGTHLTTSLSGLQHLGVDAITVTGTGSEFVIPAGTGTLDYAHLPTISADPSVVVGLELADSLQNAPATATQAAALKTAGIDVLMAADGTLSVGSAQVEAIHTGGLTFDTADTITMDIAAGSSNEATAVANLVSAINTSAYHGDIDLLHALDGAISITDVQATTLVGAGLVFNSADTVTVGADVSAQGAAVGTHLQTSMTGLQHLGVDVVTIAGVATGVVDIQAGSGVDLAHLPQVSAPAGVLVGLEMSDAALAGLTGTQMDALASHGISVLSASDNTITLDSTAIETVHAHGLELNPADTVTMQIASANEATAVSSLVTAIGTASGMPGAYHGDVDVLDVVDNAISITDAQAATLVQAGLHFAADDTGVAVVQSHAAGTHLHTSLSDLQHLGVDVVHTDAGQDTVVVSYGTGLSAGTLPVFDAQDQVKLAVQDTGLAQVVTGANALHIDAQIDQLDVVLNTTLGSTAGLSGNGILESAIQAAFGASSGAQHGIELEVANTTLPEITLGMVLDAADGGANTLHTLSGTSLATALQAAGITDLHIDALTHFTITDSDLKPLLDAGLITAASGADIKVTNAGADGTLDVSLAQLTNIGADHVQTGGTTLTLDAGVNYSNLSDLQAALNGLVNTFNAQGVGTSASTALFENSDTVELRVAGDLHGQTLTDTTLLTKLQLLGIDEIRDEHGNNIKPS